MSTDSQDIAPLLAGASRSLLAAMMSRVAERGFRDLTPAFATLMPLLDDAGARPSVLAQRARITKQAISQLVRELEARGYVEQAPDPSDTRAKIVRLTKRGMALRTACQRTKQELNSAALEALGSSRFRRLNRDLADLTAVLNRMSVHPRSEKPRP